MSKLCRYHKQVITSAKVLSRCVAGAFRVHPVSKGAGRNALAGSGKREVRVKEPGGGQGEIAEDSPKSKTGLLFCVKWGIMSN